MATLSLTSALWRRLRGAPAPGRPGPAARPLVPAEHLIQAGPARGLRLLANDRAPAFRDMIAGTYDAFLHEALDRAAIDPAVVLDVGAHIGYHSLCFAARYPQARVVAFEPNPANADRIADQLRLDPNIAARVELRREALADADGEEILHASHNVEDQTSSGSHLRSVRAVLPEDVYRKAGFAEVAVPVRRLDGLVREQGWTGIGLIKIDVEGAEHLVLQGARELLARERPLLLVEVHSVACMLGVASLLLPMGYRIDLLQEEDARRAFIMART